MPSSIFSERFLLALQSLVDRHHGIYPRLPPTGLYFESLVEEAFKIIRQPFTPIEPSNPNSPRHDLLVEDQRISIKTQTGSGTHRDHINITKLCTTERDPWEAETLRRHVLDHLSRYDHILMLRAVWDGPVVHYQVLEIPIPLLKRMRKAELDFVGRRRSRRSIAGDVHERDQRLFRVHFDGSDGKCQIQRLRIDRCRIMFAWDYQTRD